MERTKTGFNKRDSEGGYRKRNVDALGDVWSVKLPKKRVIKLWRNEAHQTSTLTNVSRVSPSAEAPPTWRD